MNEIQISGINNDLNCLSGLFLKHHLYTEETRINTTSLIYPRNTYRHYIDYMC